MVIVHSYVKLPEGTHIYHLGKSWMDSASSIILCHLGQLDLASKLDVRLEEA